MGNSRISVGRSGKVPFEASLAPYTRPMSLIVTGTIGIDTVYTPSGHAERVLGGSCTYFAAAASFSR